MYKGIGLRDEWTVLASRIEAWFLRGLGWSGRRDVSGNGRNVDTSEESIASRD